MENGRDYSPFSCTLTFMPSWNGWTTAMSWSGYPNLTMIFHSPSLQTVLLNPLVRSTKVVNSPPLCSLHFLVISKQQDHVSGAVSLVKTTLTFGEQAAFQVFNKVIEQDTGQNLPSNGVQEDAIL